MGVAMGESAAASDAELEHLPGDEGPMVVPLEGGTGDGRGWRRGLWRRWKTTLAADVEASAAQMDAWVVFKDGSGGRRVPKSS
jgi:hypothetical protein